MRRNLLNNLCLIFVLGIFVRSASAENFFIIFDDNADLPVLSDHMELAGAKVRQRIPPNILIADLPDNMSVRSLPNIKTAYSSPIALTVLEPMGPIAVAAGIQWNRSLVHQTAVKGAGVASMKALMAQNSLPLSKKLTPTVTGNKIHIIWEAVDGALAYDVEGSYDSDFSNKFFASRTNEPEMDAPLPEGTGQKTIYVRVRGVDEVSGVNNQEEVNGNWLKSPAISVTATPTDTSLSAPEPSGPVDNSESIGFSIILEWGGTAPESRIQISRSNTFANTLVDAITEGEVFVCPSPGLSVGDTLYWRVKTWGNTKSGWSAVRSVRVGAPRHQQSDVFVNPEAPK